MNNIHENESNDASGSGAPREDTFLMKQNNHCLKRIISFRLISLLLVAFAGCSILINLINPMIVGAAGNDKNKLTEEDIKKIIEYLQATNPEFTSYSYDQLNQWFENQTPESFKFEEYPRLYPFCVTHEQVSDPSRTADESHLAQFHEIFEEMERVDEKFYNFNETKHSMVFNKEWVEEIELTRINTPELDMVNLRQWLHIRVKMAQRTQGLYMQTIVGPMGLPFGEFYLDFPCKDDITHTRDMNTVGQLSYCAYRPRTSIQHPSVYVGYDENGRDEFHMHFYWTDITCMETPYLQFLMLIVKDFDYNSTVKGGAKLGEQYLPLLSPVYLNTNFDSKSGARKCIRPPTSTYELL